MVTCPWFCCLLVVSRHFNYSSWRSDSYSSYWLTSFLYLTISSNMHDFYVLVIMRCVKGDSFISWSQFSRSEHLCFIFVCAVFSVVVFVLLCFVFFWWDMCSVHRANSDRRFLNHQEIYLRSFCSYTKETTNSYLVKIIRINFRWPHQMSFYPFNYWPWQKIQLNNPQNDIEIYFKWPICQKTINFFLISILIEFFQFYKNHFSDFSLSFKHNIFKHRDPCKPISPYSIKTASMTNSRQSSSMTTKCNHTS